MVCGNKFFHSWREKGTPISKLPAKEIPNQTKLKYFESAVDDITTSSHSSPEDKVSEVFGFSPSKFSAFKELNTHEYNHFGPTVNRSTSYLICICYIKYIYISTGDIANSLIYNEIKAWLELFNNCGDLLEKKYVNEISINNSKIKFNGGRYKDYLETDLNKKFNFKKYIHKVIYTKKLKQLSINKIYANKDGKCKGIARYWLLNFARAYHESRTNRKNIKNTFVTSMEIKNNLDRPKAFSNIEKYHVNEDWYKDDLFYLQNFYEKNQQLGETLFTVTRIMQAYNINELFLEIVTFEHEIGIIIIGKGELLKLSCYDPNDEDLYFSVLFQRDQITPKSLNSLVLKIPYFHEIKSKNIAVTAKCYTISDIPNYISTSSNLDYRLF